jgi:mono/diheme cytochrome c family protein
MLSTDKAKQKGQWGNHKRIRRQPRGLRVVVSFLTIVWCLFPMACSQQMSNQPKYEPLEPSSFFDNTTSARPLVEGTVPRGSLREDTLLYTGRSDGGRSGSPGVASGQLPAGPNSGVEPSQGTTLPPRSSPPMPAAPLPGGKMGPGYAITFPFLISPEVLDRGQERFNIHCSPCHDRLGTGNGMVVQRGYRRPPSFHTERLRQAPVGYFFDVITNGFGAMPDYSAQVVPSDRWAVIAYIRALQSSQNMTLEDVPAEERSKLLSGGKK